MYPFGLILKPWALARPVRDAVGAEWKSVCTKHEQLPLSSTEVTPLSSPDSTCSSSGCDCSQAPPLHGRVAGASCLSSSCPGFSLSKCGEELEAPVGMGQGMSVVLARALWVFNQPQ